MIDKPPSQSAQAVRKHNAQAWDSLAQRGAGLTRPASEAEFRDPLAAVDACGWLGNSIRGLQVLCLAAGGGRQSALYAAAGAEVTVVDISSEMLSLDRTVAAQRHLEIRTIRASMECLEMLENQEFDLVIHPVSTCYVPDTTPVFQEVARVLRPTGLYISQHKTPTNLQTSHTTQEGHYWLNEPYYRQGPLPAADPGRLRESGTFEFLHRWEELVGGICRAGFTIEDLMEPLHADQTAAQGSFGHRAQYIAPYVRIKARRIGDSHSIFQGGNS